MLRKMVKDKVKIDCYVGKSSEVGSIIAVASYAFEQKGYCTFACIGAGNKGKIEHIIQRLQALGSFEKEDWITYQVKHKTKEGMVGQHVIKVKRIDAAI